eukprot:TRINITY_DN19238_c0_g1_i1.p1 TRINITY_DN19238_c0_g1~~TRINITY_DN19238_c0_g1_i1.p1  ORF type:complete len:165 (-),score=16.16 TRINITY_DN19238_c0_g1_i1:110-550(-)
MYHLPNDKSMQSQRALVMDFPACSESIAASFECARRITSRQTTQSSISTSNPSGSLHSTNQSKYISTLCRKPQAEMTWCILRSFCPDEADEFISCNKSIPGASVSSESQSIPIMCRWTWSKFDRCLQRRADAFEKAEIAKLKTMDT